MTASFMGQRTTGLRWLARVLHKRRRITKSSKTIEPKKDSKEPTKESKKDPNEPKKESKKDSKKPKTKQKKLKFPRSLSQKSQSPSCPPPIPPSPSHSSQSCPLPLPLPTPNHQSNREKKKDKIRDSNPEPVDKYPYPEPVVNYPNPEPMGDFSNPEPMGEDLNDYQVSPMRKAFNRLDTNKDGKISPLELGSLMRSLGGNPTQAQIKSIIAEEKLTSAFDYNRCVELMDKHMKPEEFDRQLRDAFKLMDKEGSGFVSVSSLRHILTHIGEKLEPSEFDEWVRDIDVGSDGKMRYEDFIARLVAN